MCKKFTPEELNTMQPGDKDEIIFSMQDRLDALEKNYEHLVEQIRIADQQRFGRHTEKLDQIAGQLSFFNEAEAVCDLTVQEPEIDEIIPVLATSTKKKKQKGKRERQSSIRPLVEEYFTWIKKVLLSVPPKSKTADGIRYSINQEEYLRVFLTDGEVAIDNSASERALRDFTIGRKNWVTINTPRGAEASAVIYSITQTAKLNGLNVYYYIKYLLEQLVLLKDEDGNIEQSALEPLMPWSKTLPADCYSKRRQ